MKKLLNRIPASSVILGVLIILLLIFVVLSVTLRRAESEPESPAEKPAPVHTVIVSAKTIEDSIYLPGRIEADFRSRLAVDKGGRVTEILVDKGDDVVKDQLLLRIEDRLWKAMLEKAEIEEREAKRDYERWSELLEAGAVSTSEFDTVRTRYERARVQLTDAQVHVAQCEVRSPADGRINARLIELGEFAPEGAAVLELVVTDPVRLRIDVPEREIATVQLGQQVSFKVSVLGDKLFTGIVTHIAEAATIANNTFRVEVSLSNPDRQLRPGMIATAKLTRPSEEHALLLPLSSIIPQRGEHFIFIADHDRAVRRLIKIGRILSSDVLIAAGLTQGEEVIIEGHRDLIDGALITRIPAEDHQ